MEKEKLVVMLVEGIDVEKAKDIALQSWNIKNNMNTFLDVQFLQGTDRVSVSFKEDDNSNMRDVVESWGNVIDTGEGLMINVSNKDFTKQALNELDKIYYDNDSDDVFFNVED